MGATCDSTPPESSPTSASTTPMTLSYHYKDPDGNRLESQIENFGDWQASKAGEVSPGEPPVEIPVEG